MKCREVSRWMAERDGVGVGTDCSEGVGDSGSEKAASFSGYHSSPSYQRKPRYEGQGYEG